MSRARRRRLLSLAGVVALALLCALAVFLWQQRLDRADKWASVFAFLLAAGLWVVTVGAKLIRRAVRGPPAADGQSLEPPAPRWRLRGRGQLVDLLTGVLQDEDPSTPRVHVLHGLAGVGKTAVAQAVCERVRTPEVSRWWVDAQDPALLRGGLRELTHRVFRAGRHGLTVERDDLAQAWETGQPDPSGLLWDLLRADPGWLVVLDGLDDVDHLGTGRERHDGVRWLRRPQPGQLLLITTVDGSEHNFNPEWVRLHRIDLLHEADGAAVLREHAAEAGSTDEARELSRRLGGLPLALRLAGQYLGITSRSSDRDAYRTFRGFREHLDERWWDRRYWRRWGVGGPVPQRLVPQVWEPSLRLIVGKRGMRRAREMLRLLSCLSAAPVPAEVLDASTMSGSPLFGRGFSAGDVSAHLDALRDFGLVDMHGSGAAAVISLHPVVGSVNRASIAVWRDRTAYRSLVARLRTRARQQAPPDGRLRVMLSVPPPAVPAPSTPVNLAMVVDLLWTGARRLRHAAATSVPSPPPAAWPSPPPARPARPAQPDRPPGPAPPARQGREPPAQQGREPPAQQGREPPAQQGREPPAQQGREPPAQQGREPPAQQGRELFVRQGREPSVRLGREPPGGASAGASPARRAGPAPPRIPGRWHAYYEVPGPHGITWYHARFNVRPGGSAGRDRRRTYIGELETIHPTRGLPTYVLHLVRAEHRPVPFTAGTASGSVDGREILLMRVPHRMILCRHELIGVKPNGLAGLLGAQRLNRIWQRNHP